MKKKDTVRTYKDIGKKNDFYFSDISNLLKKVN